jgi:CBS domain-containing protein
MSITVRQLLEKKGHNVHSVSPQNSVFETIELMSELGVGALLVMQANNLVGIVSERDCTQKVVLKERSAKTTWVEEIMTHKLICVSPNNNIDECMAKMNENHVRHLPVVENNVVKGVITIMDVIKTIVLEKETVIEKLEDYIAGNN